MSVVTMTADINSVDIPVFESLLKKYKAKKITFEPTKTKKGYYPNQETIKAIKESEKLHKQGLLKTYKNSDELFEALMEDE